MLNSNLILMFTNGGTQNLSCRREDLKSIMMEGEIKTHHSRKIQNLLWQREGLKLIMMGGLKIHHNKGWT